MDRRGGGRTGAAVERDIIFAVAADLASRSRQHIGAHQHLRAEGAVKAEVGVEIAVEDAPSLGLRVGVGVACVGQV